MSQENIEVFIKNVKDKTDKELANLILDLIEFD